MNERTGGEKGRKPVKTACPENTSLEGKTYETSRAGKVKMIKKYIR